MIFTAIKTVGKGIGKHHNLVYFPLMKASSSFSCNFTRFMSSDAPVTKQDITDRVMEVLKGFDKVNKQKLSLESKFTSDLGLDSLDIVEVVMAFEEEFEIEIPDKVADNIKAPIEAVDFIFKELNPGSDE